MTQPQEETTTEYTSAIWKFPLRSLGSQVVSMPRGAQILAVQTQRVYEPQDHDHAEPFVWALVDQDAELVERGFLLVGTGRPIDPMDAAQGRYVGTFQLDGGSFIGHVFDMGEQS